jgi:hypothetical protein
LVVSGGVSQSQTAEAQVHSRDSTVTILVTAMPQNDRARAIAAKLQPEDFIVTEEKKNQRILSAKLASEAPPIIAVLIQDDLVSHVNNEIQCIKDFIRKRQRGRCQWCGLLFRWDDLMEIDHIIPRKLGGKEAYYNMLLIHRHCHDIKTKSDPDEW